MISRVRQVVSVLAVTGGALVLAAPAALAQGYDPTYDPDPDVVVAPTMGTQDPFVYEEEEDVYEPIGVTIFLGGGVGGFVDEDMRDTGSDVGGIWDARLAFGTTSILGLEVAYNGIATELDVPGRADEATLVGQGGEAVLRLNFAPEEPFNLYAFGGAGVKWYEVTEVDVTVADTGIRDDDTVFEVPFGIGGGYTFDNGVVLDARFTYRAVADEDLVVGERFDTDDDGVFDNGLFDDDDDALDMDTWAATARIGYEF